MRLGPDIKITADGIKFCRKMISLYTTKAEYQEAKALAAVPSSQGGYKSHASQNRTNAARMQGNLDIQLSWLERYNRPLYDEVTEVANE